jgi:hypothetical protein
MLQNKASVFYVPRFFLFWKQWKSTRQKESRLWQTVEDMKVFEYVSNIFFTLYNLTESLAVNYVIVTLKEKNISGERL